jgi:hypothetical protein
MRAVALVAPGQVKIVDNWPEPECGPTDTIVGQLIYDHPQDFAATLDAVNAGKLVPEQTVQGTFPVHDATAALASVREVPGKSWIDLTGWRDGS